MPLRWIDCDDTLPERGITVQCVAEIHGKSISTAGYIDIVGSVEIWILLIDSALVAVTGDTVTHWAPIMKNTCKGKT